VGAASSRDYKQKNRGKMPEEIRIGVFVCDCGTNIAGVVDVPAVVEYSRGLEHVVLADEGRWSCSVDYLSKMQDLIRENKINRVVVASCTPRTHQHPRTSFLGSYERAGNRH
jgi:heterodisulfide reductase subunit A